MSELVRNGAGAIKDVVIAVVLCMSVALECWCAKTVIDQGKEIASLKTQVVAQNTSMVKVELAIVSLATTAGKLEGVAIGQQNLVAGLNRIEEALKEHMKKP